MSQVFPFGLPEKELRQYARSLVKENRTWPKTMQKLPPESHWAQTAKTGGRLLEVWRSRFFLCQVYLPEEGHHVQRLSICRVTIDTTNRRWRDGLSWDDLMLVKRECGYGGYDAVEVYPRDVDVVNVANFRHLWVFLNGGPGWVWRSSAEAIQ